MAVQLASMQDGVADLNFVGPGVPGVVNYSLQVGGIELATFAIGWTVSACQLPDPLVSGVQQGLQIGFEGDELGSATPDGWTQGRTVDGIEVIGEDTFGTPTVTTVPPLEGEQMLRLGETRDSDGEAQPRGANEVCQDFEVVDEQERFAFNVFTYDYTGFDEFRYEVPVQDAEGDTIARYVQGAFGLGGDTSLKSSGWRAVELNLSEYVGETVRITLSAGGTLDNLFGFWSYVDSAVDADIEVLPPNVIPQVPSGTSVTTDPSTGLFTVAVTNPDITGDVPGDLNLAVPVSCDGTIVSAAIGFNGATYQATVSNGVASATIPGAALANFGFSAQNVTLLVDCDGTSSATVIGSIVLYDPSGFITDAASGAPIVGAQVELYRVPGWGPKTDPDDDSVNTCESNRSKDADADWSQPAPVDEGVLEPAASARISPNVNPQFTDDRGYYGWDVAEGCWYVEVTAAGYQPLTSPVVGVPPEVTDLDLQLTRRSTGVRPVDDVGDEDDAPRFSDVAPDGLHADAIEELASRGIVLGYDDGTYRPLNPVQRGHMASFITRALDLEDGGTAPYSDTAGTTHEGSIAAVTAAGIAAGYGDDTFRPMTPISREQMATFLARAAGLDEVDEGPFGDIAGSRHAGNINAIAAADITSGTSMTTFDPGQPVTRQQMATFLVNLLEFIE